MAKKKVTHHARRVAHILFSGISCPSQMNEWRETKFGAKSSRPLVMNASPWRACGDGVDEWLGLRVSFRM